jgi:hypothetical protein
MSMQPPATAGRRPPSLAGEQLPRSQLDQPAAVAQPLLTIPER